MGLKPVCHRYTLTLWSVCDVTKDIGVLIGSMVPDRHAKIMDDEIERCLMITDRLSRLGWLKVHSSVSSCSSVNWSKESSHFDYDFGWKREVRNANSHAKTKHLIKSNQPSFPVWQAHQYWLSSDVTQANHYDLWAEIWQVFEDFNLSLSRLFGVIIHVTKLSSNLKLWFDSHYAWILLDKLDKHSIRDADHFPNSYLKLKRICLP